MSLKKFAWNIFETTGDIEAYLAMKEIDSSNLAQNGDSINIEYSGDKLDGNNQN